MFINKRKVAGHVFLLRKLLNNIKYLIRSNAIEESNNNIMQSVLLLAIT